ncbi:acyltransferase 3, partial [Achlya hypogyna]
MASHGYSFVLVTDSPQSKVWVASCLQVAEAKQIHDEYLISEPKTDAMPSWGDIVTDESTQVAGAFDYHLLTDCPTPPLDLSNDTKTESEQPNAYRPDVDGLRTLAVVPVVVFHAYPDLLPGGFIGVDVFFVISGFLISGILFKEFERGKFTYAGFYQRRVRRIFPTLILVLGVTFWLGYLYLMAPKLKAMAATMLAGTLFGANLQVLTLEHSYFDLDVKTNPLLHLWSLGVEEQFYIFWPFLASVVMKLSYKKAVALQAVVLVVSFVTNVSFLGYHGNDKMSFYMPLSRFWQMAMGGLLAYMSKESQRESDQKSGKGAPDATLALPDGFHIGVMANAASVTGFGLVLLGLICINEARSFPGFWALLPTIGATLLIAAGPNAVFNYFVLSNSVGVYIGKISYCLYLWHWPLLVLAIERFPDAKIRPFYLQPYAMILTSIFLSVLTYETVEGRVRRHKSKLVTPILVVCMVGLAALSGCAIKYPADFSATEKEIAQAQESMPMAQMQAMWANTTTATSPAAIAGGVASASQQSLVAPTTRAVTASTRAPPTPAPVEMHRVVMPTVVQARIGAGDRDWNVGAGDTCASDSAYIMLAKTPMPFPYKDPTSPDYPEYCQV